MKYVRYASRIAMWVIAVILSAYLLGYVVGERLAVCGAIFVPCTILVGQP